MPSKEKIKCHKRWMNKIKTDKMNAKRDLIFKLPNWLYSVNFTKVNIYTNRRIPRTSKILRHSRKANLIRELESYGAPCNGSVIQLADRLMMIFARMRSLRIVDKVSFSVFICLLPVGVRNK